MELDAARRASDAARAYADTIIESVREPLAVLDEALRILRANPAFVAHLGIPRQDIEGRFLHEVGDGRWNIPDLHHRLRALLASAKPLEGWEATRELLPQGRQVMNRSAVASKASRPSTSRRVDSSPPQSWSSNAARSSGGQSKAA